VEKEVGENKETSKLTCTDLYLYGITAFFRSFCLHLSLAGQQLPDPFLLAEIEDFKTDEEVNLIINCLYLSMT
jgi:hypothetical protein